MQTKFYKFEMHIEIQVIVNHNVWSFLFLNKNEYLY